MASPLTTVLSKARSSLGGPLAGLQGPQIMQMPNRSPFPPQGIPGMPQGIPGGMPGGMMPESPVSGPSGAPMTSLGMPMGGAPGNTGIIPPHMRQPGMNRMGMGQRPNSRMLASVMRKMQPQRFGNAKAFPMGDMPSMPSAPPGAALA